MGLILPYICSSESAGFSGSQLQFVHSTLHPANGRKKMTHPKFQVQAKKQGLKKKQKQGGYINPSLNQLSTYWAKEIAGTQGSIYLHVSLHPERKGRGPEDHPC